MQKKYRKKQKQPRFLLTPICELDSLGRHIWLKYSFLWRRFRRCTHCGIMERVYG